MKRLLLAGVMVLTSGTVTIGAQGPGGRRPGPGPMPGPGTGAMGRGGPGGGALDDPAEFLLSHTGELRLTDAQVTRLAAIARRSADRRQTLRTRMDSLRSQRPLGERPDSAARAQMRQRFEQMRPDMERLRDQSQADRRDAIAVLTPDQQAQAWERIARVGQPRGGRPGRGFAGPGRGRMGNGAMPGRPGMRGQGVGPRRMGPPSDAAGAPPEVRRPARRPRPEIEN
jgi:hypothetical protein